jgi:ankyrin repeat protein
MTISGTFDHQILKTLFRSTNDTASLLPEPTTEKAVSLMLLLKTKTDSSDLDSTPLYLQQWARFMSAQKAWQSDTPDNYYSWLETACLATVYERGPMWSLLYLVQAKNQASYLDFDVNLPSKLLDSCDPANTGDSVPLKEAHGALQLACQQGNLTAVKILLDSGVDQSARHSLFGVPLFNAVRNGHAAIVQCLLDRDRNIPLPHRYSSLLRLALDLGHSEVFEVLLKSSRGEEKQFLNYCFFNACHQGQVDIVRTLYRWCDGENLRLRRNPLSWFGRLMPWWKDETFFLNPNVQLQHAQTPVSEAVRSGNVEMVRILIERPEFQPCHVSDYCCPLYVAAECDNGEMVTLVLGRYKRDRKDTLDRIWLTFKDACANGRSSAVKAFLEWPTLDPNLRAHNRSWSPIADAIRLSHRPGNYLEVIKLLVGHEKLDPNFSNIGRRPLELAIDVKSHPMAEHLLSRPDLDPNLHGGLYTPLSEAIRKNMHDTVRIMLERPDTDPNLRSEHNPDGTPLITAIHWGTPHIVEELLKREDLDPNLPSTVSKPAKTALTSAAGFGDEQVVKLLLSRDGIDVNLSTSEHTPLSQAIMSRKLKIIEMLMGHQHIDPNRAPDMSAAMRTYSRVAGKSGYTFTKSPTADQTSDAKNIPLCLAMELQEYEVASMLLKHPEIDIHMTDGTNRTPLWWAAFGGSPALVRLLLENGVDKQINIQDVHGRAPLHVAANSGYPQLVGDILAHPDSDPNLVNEDGYTALHLGVICNNVDIVPQLLKCPKVNSDLVTNAGETALHLAESLGYQTLVGMLRDNGRPDL